MREESLTVLTGRVLKVKRAQGTEKSLLNSPEELEQAVAEHFGIIGAPVASLWPKIARRHAELFGDRPVEDL
jgi:adenylosuccinate lyase